VETVPFFASSLWRRGVGASGTRRQAAGGEVLGGAPTDEEAQDGIVLEPRGGERVTHAEADDALAGQEAQDMVGAQLGSLDVSQETGEAVKGAGVLGEGGRGNAVAPAVEQELVDGVTKEHVDPPFD